MEYGIHSWDVAASAVIVAEAGGILLDPTGTVGERGYGSHGASIGDCLYSVV